MATVEPTQYHLPVMARECLEYLAVRPEGTYADGTLGGGGHSALILAQMQDAGRLHSFDADDVAIRHCTERFASELQRGSASRIVLHHTNFVHMPEVMADHAPVDGVLLDLGVSSYQFDHHARGFSHRLHAPLDMRFGQEGPTAAELLESMSEADIASMLFRFGEEPMSRRIAAAIVRRRLLSPVRTTTELRDLLATEIPPHHLNKTLARTFQALRIAVNDELTRLAEVLERMIPLMSIGGRLVVMSYHSLEDRIVKTTFKRFATGKRIDEHEGPGLRILTSKPVEASDEEQHINPRSRSAKLRAAERVC